MSKEVLRIAKGGKLIETKWVYDKVAKQGSYQEFDRTDQAIRKLFEVCELEEGVVLKDIFLLLNSELDVFDAVLGNWCKEIVTEGLTQPAKPYDLSKYDPEQIEYLELTYTPEYENDGEKDDPNYLYGFHRPDFNATGVVLQNDGDQEHFKKGERVPWGISLTASNDLINIPVKLSDKFVVYEGILKCKDKPGFSHPIVEFDNPTYTLGGILMGIIWELSFHGGPDKRTDFGKELKEMVADIKSGKEPLLSAEEVLKNIKENK